MSSSLYKTCFIVGHNKEFLSEVSPLEEIEIGCKCVFGSLEQARKYAKSLHDSIDLENIAIYEGHLIIEKLLIRYTVEENMLMVNKENDD